MRRTPRLSGTRAFSACSGLFLTVRLELPTLALSTVMVDPRLRWGQAPADHPRVCSPWMQYLPVCRLPPNLRNSGSVRLQLIWHRGRGRRSENAGLAAFLLRGLRKPSASSVIHLRKVEQDPARGGETRGWSAGACPQRRRGPTMTAYRASRAGLNGPNPVQPWREQRSAASGRHSIFMAMQRYRLPSLPCNPPSLLPAQATASVGRNIATAENGGATCRGLLLPLWPPFSRFHRSGFPLFRAAGATLKVDQSDAGKIEDLHVGQRIQGLQRGYGQNSRDGR